jgi:hypothetical protein
MHRITWPQMGPFIRRDGEQPPNVRQRLAEPGCLVTFHALCRDRLGLNHCMHSFTSAILSLASNRAIRLLP